MSVLPGASNILLALLACSMPSILPAMSLHEVLEVKRNYSVKGLLPTDRHHLAPRGVLSLDELPELSTQTLEVLRQPLEDKLVTLARAGGTIAFPGNVSLIANQPEPPS